MARVHIGALIHQGLVTEVRAALLDAVPCIVKLARASSRAAAAVRLDDEVAVLSRLRGPHIVKALGQVRWQGREGLVLEHAGVTLESEVPKPSGLSDEVIAAVGLALAAALRSCAQAVTAEGRDLQLVHRDIAPQNIFVDASGQVRLGDFGYAWFQGRAAQTQVGQVFGTEGFMAPEHLAGALPRPSADHYAVACVLSWMHQPARAPAHPARAWSGPIADWVRWALSEAASDRPSDTEGLHEACRAVLGKRNPQAVLHGLGWGQAQAFDPISPADAEASVDLLTLYDSSQEASDSPALDLFMGLNAPPSPRTRVAAPVPQQELRDASTRVDRPDSMRTSISEPAQATPQAELSAVPTRIQPSTLSAPAGLAPPTEVQEAGPGIGSELYGYRLEAVLGQGQWGCVYLGRHSILDQEVAVKVLHASMVPLQGAVQRFFREAQTLSQLDHPNVVRVQTCGYGPDGTPFLVMERLAGPSLKETLDPEAPMSPEQAMPLLREIALGLVAAHEAGLVHRDLKPGNVLMTQSLVAPRLKIVDFGVAHLSNADNPITRTKELLGSPAYMAPEQILKSRDVDPRADLYSLGVLAYRLLSGKNPFRGSALKVMKAHLESAPPALHPSGILDELVQDLLQKSPERRPQSAAEVVQRLDALARPSPATVLTPRPVVKAPRWIGPTIVVGLALVAGLSAAWLGAQERAPAPRPPAKAQPLPVRAVAAPEPGAQPAPGVEAMPPPAAVVDAGPRAPRRPTRRVAPRPLRKATASQLAKQLGLPLGDLRALAGAELKAYDAATSKAELADALSALGGRVDDESAARMQDLLRRRLREAKAALKAAAPRLPAQQVASLESQLLDVQERAVGARGATQTKALLRALSGWRAALSPR